MIFLNIISINILQYRAVAVVAVAVAVAVADAVAVAVVVVVAVGGAKRAEGFSVRTEGKGPGLT